MNKVKTYVQKGVTFLRDHPQLWMTALVGVSIIFSFLFMSWRFTLIAQNAQEELVNVRVGSILDAFVVFAPDTIDTPDILRERLVAIRKDNPTIDSFTIFAEHGNDAWRVYISDGGPREGTVLSDMSLIFNYALADPSNAYTFESKNAQERKFTTARAITNEAGNPIAIAVVSQGMAEADKKITDNIHNSMYILFGLLAIITIIFLRHARIVDFAILYKKQLEIDEMKDSFIGMASHELKSPLTAIRGYIEFLKDDSIEADKKHEYLRRIDVSADELKQLVDDILDVSRIEMGRLRFASEYVHPSAVIEEVIDAYHTEAHAHNLELNFKNNIKDNKPIIRVDRTRLKQVMVNLVSNAIKYTQKGSITVSLEEKDDTIYMSVKDTGIGMSAEAQKKLFSKFYRVQSEETKAVSGTGLGLWITKYIVEQMRGTISVESIRGEGSRFTVTFPVHREK
jgi:K+-sensing histidine kinase KdpD